MGMFTNTNIPDCDNYNVATVASQEKTVSTNQGVHDLCRAEEYTEYANMTGDCDPLIAQLRTWDHRSAVADPNDWNSPSGTVSDICILPTVGVHDVLTPPTLQYHLGNIMAW